MKKINRVFSRRHEVIDGHVPALNQCRQKLRVRQQGIPFPEEVLPKITR